MKRPLDFQARLSISLLVGYVFETSRSFLFLSSRMVMDLYLDVVMRRLRLDIMKTKTFVWCVVEGGEDIGRGVEFMVLCSW